MDKIDYDRYGWLKPEDFEVINSMALPLGEIASYITLYIILYYHSILLTAVTIH